MVVQNLVRSAVAMVYQERCSFYTVSPKCCVYLGNILMMVIRDTSPSTCGQHHSRGFVGEVSVKCERVWVECELRTIQTMITVDEKLLLNKLQGQTDMRQQYKMWKIVVLSSWATKRPHGFELQQNTQVTCFLQSTVLSGERHNDRQ